MTGTIYLPNYRPPEGLTHKRPEDLRAYLKWEDAWRTRLLDLAANMADGNREAFQIAAAVVLAGHLANYDG